MASLAFIVSTKEMVALAKRMKSKMPIST